MQPSKEQFDLYFSSKTIEVRLHDLFFNNLANCYLRSQGKGNLVEEKLLFDQSHYQILLEEFYKEIESNRMTMGASQLEGYACIAISKIEALIENIEGFKLTWKENEMIKSNHYHGRFKYDQVLLDLIPNHYWVHLGDDDLAPFFKSIDKWIDELDELYHTFYPFTSDAHSESNSKTQNANYQLSLLYELEVIEHLRKKYLNNHGTKMINQLICMILSLDPSKHSSIGREVRKLDDPNERGKTLTGPVKKKLLAEFQRIGFAPEKI